MPMSPEKAREKRMRIAAEEGRVFVPKTPTGLDRSDMAEYRRQYKRNKRREAGARLRVDIQAEAQAKREAVELRRAQRLAAVLHDAHVKRWAYLLSARAKYARRYEANPKAEIARQSRRKQALPDSYVIQNIKAMGIPADVITPALIAIKREAMQYHRMSRTIKTTVKNHLKEDHETISKHP